MISVDLSPALADEPDVPGPTYFEEKMYPIATAGKPCVRLLDKDGVIGCSTLEAGTIGTLYPIYTQRDLEEFTSSSWYDTKAIVLQGGLLNSTVVHRLHKTGVVSGIIVNNDLGNETLGFSPATKYPNKEWGLYADSKHEWNPSGSGWAYDSVPIPLFAFDEDGAFMEKANENKQSGGVWPRWAVEFNDHMQASINAHVCLRRGICDPVGGESVWAGLSPAIDPNATSVIAMAQMDSNAMFHDLATGGSQAASTAALMGAMEAMMRSGLPPPQRQILFAFWTGESWGYLGSSKFVQDIQAFQCEIPGDDGTYCAHPYINTYAFRNVSLPKIDALLEVNEIAFLDPQRPEFYLHQDGAGVQELTETLIRVGAQVNVSVLKASGGLSGELELPPSSIQSFLMANRSIPAISIGDFNTHFENKYYFSRWDNADNVGMSNGYQSVCITAKYVAHSLWALANGTAAHGHDFEVNCSFIGEVMKCLVEDNLCPLKKEFLHLTQSPNPPSAYVGVFNWMRNINTREKFVYTLLRNITSQTYQQNQTLCNKTSDCPKGLNLYCSHGACMNSSVHYHPAVSTGMYFDVDYLYLQGLLQRWAISNESRPTWTESQWETFGVRVFLMDDPAVEVFALAIGIAETFVAWLACWAGSKVVYKRFNILD